MTDDVNAINHGTLIDEGKGGQSGTAGSEASGAETQPAADSAKKQRQTRLWQLGIVVVLGVFVWFLVIGLQRQNTSEQRASGMAPDFTFTTFEGETISLADLEGQGIVLNFWASWCEPCRVEADLLEQTWRAEKDNGIIFLGLDYLDQEHAALEYLAEFDITYPNGPDLQSTLARRYGIKGVPETFFIDPEGRIAGHKIGPVAHGELAQFLDEIRP